MFDATKSVLAKFHSLRGNQGKPNPFKDIRIIHKETDTSETIKIQLECIEELNIDALEKLMVELIIADVVKHNYIKIESHRQGNSSNIRYEGKLTVMKDPESIL